MLRRLFILMAVPFVVGLPFLVISCKDNEREIVYLNSEESGNILNEYADFQKKYIEVVAAADAIGGILGFPVAAVLASGAAALYFEVE